MNKEKYYEISKSENLPKRCPILNYCMRRAYTMYMFSEFNKNSRELNVVKALQNEGYLPSDFEEKKIGLQGEDTFYQNGSDSSSFNNMCPEVSLFDTEHALIYARGLATVSGNWDKERVKDKFQSTENKHFSECAEFSKYHYEKSFKTKK
ncbi:MAG: hypothetical protein U0U67_09065 [Chitinophagales bacterium]